MPANIQLLIENRKNSGTNPNITIQLPHDKQAHKFSDLAKKKQIQATHVSFNAPSDAQSVMVHIEGGPQTDHGAGIKLNVGGDGTPAAFWDGQEVDVGGWFIAAT